MAVTWTNADSVHRHTYAVIGERWVNRDSIAIYERSRITNDISCLFVFRWGGCCWILLISSRAQYPYKDALLDCHHKDKTVVRPPYIYYGNPYTTETKLSYWEGPMGHYTGPWGNHNISPVQVKPGVMKVTHSHGYRKQNDNKIVSLSYALYCK